MSVSTRPVLGISIGDPAGIGPEIITACLADPELPQTCDYRQIGRAEGHRPGYPTLASARAVADALEEAGALLAAGNIQGIVTAPVAKKALHEAGFVYPGQTEFFAARSGTQNYAMCRKSVV